MSEEKEVEKSVEEEKSVKVIKVVATIVIGLFGLGSGTSPWWYKEIVAKDNKPEQPRVESGEVSEPKPASEDDLAKMDRSGPENRYRQREEKWGDSRRGRGRGRYRGRWRDRRSWDRERDRETADSRWRDPRPDMERPR